MEAIVKCKPTREDKEKCPMFKYCLARVSDPTISGCNLPFWYAGLIPREDIKIEHTVIPSGFGDGESE